MNNANIKNENLIRISERVQLLYKKEKLELHYPEEIAEIETSEFLRALSVNLDHLQNNFFQNNRPLTDDEIIFFKHGQFIQLKESKYVINIKFDIDLNDFVICLLRTLGGEIYHHNYYNDYFYLTTEANLKLSTWKNLAKALAQIQKDEIFNKKT